ncbi:MAG: NAD-dependent epimerase/dehydratase family protein, partial [Candidatus Altiarchaeota archaeon]|nr:NAD-dependent epimerase/dehydratase family protein [Candidatus Altiarchaeota archaeon]
NEGYEVAVVDNLSTGRKKNLNRNAKFYRTDITSHKLSDVFRKEKPEYVIHLAAQINVRDSIKNPSNDAKINVLGSINLLSACTTYGVKKIIYSSSGGAVYGEPVKNPTPESHPIAPMCPYGASKYCVEKYIELYNKSHNLDYNILRYGNVYGPRQDPLGEAGVVAIFTKLLVDGKKPRIFGDGKQTRDFCFVEDVAKANIAGLEKKGKSKIYNVGTGKPSSVNDVTEKLLKHTRANVKPVNVAEIPGEVRHIYLDVSLIKKELRWMSKTSLDDGIKKTVEWVK